MNTHMIDDWKTYLNEHLFENGFWAAFSASAVIGLLAYILIKLTNRTLRHMAEKGRFDAANTTFFRRIIDVGIGLLACVGIFLQVKPLHSVATSLLASSGVLAVIIGFAAQQAMANVVGGFFISVFKPFGMGDRIKIYEKDVDGVVEDISLRHTVIRTAENNRVIVPNSVMNAAIIENTQFQDGKVCKFLDIGVCLDADLDRAMQIMLDEVCSHRDCYDNRTDQEKKEGVPPVTVRLINLKDGVATLRAVVWARDAGVGYVMVCDLLLSIKKRFDSEGIELPGPLYLKK